MYVSRYMCLYITVLIHANVYKDFSTYTYTCTHIDRERESYMPIMIYGTSLTRVPLRAMSIVVDVSLASGRAVQVEAALAETIEAGYSG